MKFIALIGLLALTACGTYAVRVYDYGNAERGEAPAEAPAERGEDKGDDADGKDKGSEKGEADTGKGGRGKGDKGKDGDDD
jgi:hypothetical protein